MLSLGQFHTHVRTRAIPILNMTSANDTKRGKELQERILSLLPYFLAILLWAALVTHGQYYLKKVEDLSLFLFDWLYFKDAIKIPGGFLGVAGSFFTQFLYYPWLGSLIWVFMLIVCYQLTIKTLSIPAQYKAFAIIPVTLLVIGNMSLGYGVYIMREQDHFFAPALGYLTALLPLLTTKGVRTQSLKILLLLVWAAAGFQLSGTFALTGVLAAALASLTDSESTRKNRLTLLAAAIVFILLIPLVSYNFYTSYRLADSWHLGLPTPSDDLWTRHIRAPFQLALLYIPVMSIAVKWLKDDTDRKTFLVQAAFYISSIAAVWGFWFKDDNFRTELAMSLATDRNDWQAVVDIYKKASDSKAGSDEKAFAARSKALNGVKDANEIKDIIEKYSGRFFEPTRSMILYRDLALLKLNRALDEAFTYKDGGRPQKTPHIIPMAFQSGKQFYFQYGLVNMSYRWCLEDVIEHGWSFSTLKYMSMHCVIMNETEFSHKYIRKLKKTLFYRRWAIEQESLAADSIGMAAAEPYKSVLPYMCFEDRMTNDMVKSETFLMRHYSEPEPLNPTPEYDRAALLWAMRIQNIPFFWQRLYYYLKTNHVDNLPRGVEEAALLYSNLEKGGLDIPYSKSVTDSYNAFTGYVKSHPIHSMEESAYPYSKRFGKTFYYYYYFIRNLQTY